MPPSPSNHEIPENTVAQYGKIIQTATAPPTKERSIRVGTLEHLVKIASDAQKPVLRYNLPNVNKDDRSPEEAMFYTVDEGRHYVYQASLVRPQQLTQAISNASRFQKGITQAKTLSSQPSISVGETAAGISLGQRAQTQEQSLFSLNVFSNIWLLRSLIMACSLVVSLLLLTYSFIFLQTFFSFANTTSYFPWSWAVDYTNSGQILNLFYIGLGVSITFVLVSANLLGYFFKLFRRSQSYN